MLISYNWLKWYIPEIPSPDKLTDAFTYHICEVESLYQLGTGENADWIFDINILPNRAHDLLSHLGVARELASFLNIEFKDPAPMYKIPEVSSRSDLGNSKGPTLSQLKIDIQTPKCRRYMGRIVRNIKIGPSPDWVVKHLESVGQRSINNIVDAANIVMFDCGQPIHAFDLEKVSGRILIREAKDEETIVTLDNKKITLNRLNMVIADEEKALAIAGIKGGKVAEVDNNTKDIILEVANFDPVSVRKTAQSLNIFTDARKRFENDLSPELGSYAMRELSGLILEMCPEASFEEVVDVYPNKQEIRTLSFSIGRISEILGLSVSKEEIENILKRYNFEFKLNNENFEITIPPMRLDLVAEEDMAEEIGRVIGYDKIAPVTPKINFTPRQNETHNKITWARNKLLNDGYSEVMTYVFKDKGEIEVMQSASDKKFLRTNLTDGLRESMNLNNINFFLFGVNDTRIFEIGTVWYLDEKVHVAYFSDEEDFKPKEVTLGEFCKDMPLNFSLETRNYNLETKFKPWSVFPFISRDIAVWVPENVSSGEVEKIIKNNAGELVVKGPELFDSFTKPASLAGGDGKTSYAFRLVFQSNERTLKDEEVNEIMAKIGHKISENSSWVIR